MINITKEVKKIENDIISWRRDLHRIPEYDFDLFKTSDYIQKKLSDFNIPYVIMAKTGIVATLKGSNSGKTLALRADMDALPIEEETNLPFSSTHPGYMHACGHDAHMAIMLGVAKIASENRHLINGNIKFIFQPAEETTGGAKVMIEQGCLMNPNVDEILGLHIGEMFNEVDNGQIGYKHGGMMASVDAFEATILGKGGHGAMPHKCIDPLLISCEIITSIQKLISRETDPNNPVVITVGKLNSGLYYNIVPNKSEFSATIRTLSDSDRDYVEKRIEQVINGISIANNAKAKINYKRYYPSLINSESINNKLLQSINGFIDNDDIIEIKKPNMGAEDMSYYLREIPGCFFILGSRKYDKNGISYPHHNPKFDINESVLWKGVAVFLNYIKFHYMD